ncbi:MAG: VOC family protein, partial [Alphaproteobacteria bacterium]|nr:VOC family protein [Alphaproteobacteria bacterium]
MPNITTYPIFQHAYFVNDIEEACMKWHKLFGAGPFWAVPHHKTDKFDYRGTDHEADVSYAFGYIGDEMIQFIQQHDDTPSIYMDMFKPGEEGYHHLGCLVHDFEKEFKRLEDMGFECATRLYADEVDA